jgi:adenylate cyclase
MSDRDLLIEAHHVSVDPLLIQGKLLSSKNGVDQVEALYDFNQHGSHSFTYGHDPAACSLGIKALALWHMGYPEQALQTLRKAETIVRALEHPFSQCIYLSQADQLRELRGDNADAFERVQAGRSLCDERGFVEYSAIASARIGSILSRQGQTSRGLEQMKAAIAQLRSLQEKRFETLCLMWLAEANAEAGDVETGLQLLEEALATMEKRGERVNAAEARRLKGEMLLKRSRTEEAGHCFQEALYVARNLDAKSWELRATTSLARLLRDTNRRDEARTMLSEIYNWFTEGFDTADLKDAKALLDELGA